MTLWSHGLIRSGDKLKSYLDYHNVYGHQTWEYGNLPCGLLPIKPMAFWSRGLMRSRGKLKSLYLHYHSVYGHQTWKMVIYFDELLLIKSHDPLITWSYKIKWETKIIISSLPQCLWPSNVARWWFIWMGSSP